MDQIVALASANLLSPMVLFFVVGLIAALIGSDLTIPEAIAKGMSLYLLLAIGFKGGVDVSAHGVDTSLVMALVAGILLSGLMPFVAMALLRGMTNLSRVDAAAVAAHYGSISVVTFVAAISMLEASGIAFEGYMVAVAAVMEAPAILTALVLYRMGQGESSDGNGSVMRTAFLNGSITLLVGAFFVGWISGVDGMGQVEAFISTPFKGVLTLFLLDMGLLAGRGLRRSASDLSVPLIAFGIIMPLIGAAAGLASAWLIGLSLGGTVILATLAASASYIAVPAAMRVAIPEANPAIYLTLSLGITFPFNLVFGISIYLALAEIIHATGGG